MPTRPRSTGLSGTISCYKDYNSGSQRHLVKKGRTMLKLTTSSPSEQLAELAEAAGREHWGAEWERVKRQAERNDQGERQWWRAGTPGIIGDYSGNDPMQIMERRLARLARFRVWISQDPAFAALIDTTLKSRAQTISRRQVIITVAVSVVSLVVGWLLSAISPATTLAHLIGH